MRASGAEGSTSSSLLRRVKSHDPQAWQRLADLYGPLVFYWCRRAGMSSQDAADVLQEVFASVATAIDRFWHDRESGTFRGWLRTITSNKIRDHYRKQAGDVQAVGGSEALQHLAEIPDLLPGDESTDDRDQSEIAALLHRALELVRAEFQDRTWQAFWQAIVDGHSTADIAADLGITANAVRQAKSRVLRRLRQQLGDLKE